MNQVFSDIIDKFVVLYLYDILVYSEWGLATQTTCTQLSVDTGLSDPRDSWLLTGAMCCPRTFETAARASKTCLQEGSRCPLVGGSTHSSRRQGLAHYYQVFSNFKTFQEVRHNCGTIQNCLINQPFQPFTSASLTNHNWPSFQSPAQFHLRNLPRKRLTSHSELLYRQSLTLGLPHLAFDFQEGEGTSNNVFALQKPPSGSPVHHTRGDGFLWDCFLSALVKLPWELRLWRHSAGGGNSIEKHLKMRGPRSRCGWCRRYPGLAWGMSQTHHSQMPLHPQELKI